MKHTAFVTPQILQRGPNEFDVSMGGTRLGNGTFQHEIPKEGKGLPSRGDAEALVAQVLNASAVGRSVPPTRGVTRVHGRRTEFRPV